jgi:hypothetical protein
MISLEARVWTVVDAIDTDPEFYNVAEPGDGFLYVFETSQQQFGTILYTMFNAETLYPEASWAVKYGHQHFMHQVLYSGTMIRDKLDYLVDTEVPGKPYDTIDPMIIPGCTPTYPTEVPAPKKQSFL